MEWHCVFLLRLLFIFKNREKDAIIDTGMSLISEFNFQTGSTCAIKAIFYFLCTSNVKNWNQPVY